MGTEERNFMVQQKSEALQSMRNVFKHDRGEIKVRGASLKNQDDLKVENFMK